jgi:hypothetical protein
MNKQNESPSELMSQASSGETIDLRDPKSSGATLSVLEAARQYGVSIATLRRKLKEGEILGAFKAPGPKGDEWRLPVTGLEALGYRAVDEYETEVRQQRPGAEIGDLLHTMNRLMTTLDAEHGQKRSAGEGYRSAEIEAAHLRGELVGEKERRRQAEAEIVTLSGALQRQQETIDELSRALIASGSIWRWVFWAALLACLGGLVVFLVTG